jgi:hypothetical protein
MSACRIDVAGASVDGLAAYWPPSPRHHDRGSAARHVSTRIYARVYGIGEGAARARGRQLVSYVPWRSPPRAWTGAPLLCLTA